MINEKDSVSDILKEMTRRPDGIVVFSAIGISILILILNLTVYYLEPIYSFSRGKWIALWCFMPLILFFIYIRMRQLLRSESFLIVILHFFVQIGVVSFFILKNREIL